MPFKTTSPKETGVELTSMLDIIISGNGRCLHRHIVSALAQLSKRGA